MENILDRISKIADNKGISIGRFESSIGASKGVLSRAIANKTDIQAKWIVAIGDNYPEISPEWLLTGKGEMIKGEKNEQSVKEKRLIPFFDDVTTIGGCNSISAAVDGCMPASDYIDAGDWFSEAMAAIRHYGDSMVEYPSGCILVIKKVEDLRLILWGHNYVVETTEFRITKRLQKGADDTTIVAYSSNTETYQDGRQIHEPKVIPLEAVRSIWLVLGYVVKEFSSGAVFIKK